MCLIGLGKENIHEFYTINEFCEAIEAKQDRLCCQAVYKIDSFCLGKITTFNIRTRLNVKISLSHTSQHQDIPLRENHEKQQSRIYKTIDISLRKI